MAIPNSLSRSYSTFPLCSGDNLNWKSCIHFIVHIDIHINLIIYGLFYACMYKNTTLNCQGVKLRVWQSVLQMYNI
jgi:hypothetical protein